MRKVRFEWRVVIICKFGMICGVVRGHLKRVFLHSLDLLVIERGRWPRGWSGEEMVFMCWLLRLKEN